MTGQNHYQAIRLGADKKPSNGTVIASMPVLPGGGCPPEIDALWVPGQVCIAWVPYIPPVKRLAPASLGSRRRKLLKKKLERQHPLLASVLYEQALAAEPDRFFPEGQPA